MEYIFPVLFFAVLMAFVVFRIRGNAVAKRKMHEELKALRLRQVIADQAARRKAIQDAVARDAQTHANNLAAAQRAGLTRRDYSPVIPAVVKKPTTKAGWATENDRKRREDDDSGASSLLVGAAVGYALGSLNSDRDKDAYMGSGGSFGGGGASGSWDSGLSSPRESSNPDSGGSSYSSDSGSGGSVSTSD